MINTRIIFIKMLDYELKKDAKLLRESCQRVLLEENVNFLAEFVMYGVLISYLLCNFINLMVYICFVCLSCTLISCLRRGGKMGGPSAQARA